MEGRVDPRFEGERWKDLSKLLSPEARKPLIDSHLLMQEWTAERVLECVGGCKDTAPGPSGLLYWMMGTEGDELRTTVAALL